SNVPARTGVSLGRSQPHPVGEPRRDARCIVRNEMTIYEPNPDVGPTGVEFEEFADVPILDEPRPPPPRSPRHDETGVPEHVYDLLLLVRNAVDEVVRAVRCADRARAAGDEELARW